MLYAVKINNFMVKNAKLSMSNDRYYISEITLSKSIERAFKKDTAKRIADLINGEVIEINEEVTNA